MPARNNFAAGPFAKSTTSRGSVASWRIAMGRLISHQPPICLGWGAVGNHHLVYIAASLSLFCMRNFLPDERGRGGMERDAPAALPVRPCGPYRVPRKRLHHPTRGVQTRGLGGAPGKAPGKAPSATEYGVRAKGFVERCACSWRRSSFPACLLPRRGRERQRDTAAHCGGLAISPGMQFSLVRTAPPRLAWPRPAGGLGRTLNGTVDCKSLLREMKEIVAGPAGPVGPTGLTAHLISCPRSACPGRRAKVSGKAPKGSGRRNLRPLPSHQGCQKLGAKRRLPLGRGKRPSPMLGVDFACLLLLL